LLGHYSLLFSLIRWRKEKKREEEDEKAVIMLSLLGSPVDASY